MDKKYEWLINDIFLKKANSFLKTTEKSWEEPMNGQKIEKNKYKNNGKKLLLHITNVS